MTARTHDQRYALTGLASTGILSRDYTVDGTFRVTGVSGSDTLGFAYDTTGRNFLPPIRASSLPFLKEHKMSWRGCPFKKGQVYSVRKDHKGLLDDLHNGEKIEFLEDSYSR